MDNDEFIFNILAAIVLVACVAISILRYDPSEFYPIHQYSSVINRLYYSDVGYQVKLKADVYMDTGGFIADIQLPIAGQFHQKGDRICIITSEYLMPTYLFKHRGYCNAQLTKHPTGFLQNR